MSTTVTGLNQYDVSIQVPTAGDDLTASSITTGLTSLANRTRYLKELVSGTPAVPGTGVSRLAYVSDLTQLKALTTQANNDIIRVGTIGLYMYDSGSEESTDEPWVCVPDVGDGRWYHLLWYIAAQSSATARLAAITSAGKLKYPSIVPNRLVERQTFCSSGTLGASWTTITSSTWTDVSTAAVTMHACHQAGGLPGSKLYGRFQSTVHMADASIADFRLNAYYSSTDHELTGSTIQLYGPDARVLMVASGWLDISSVSNEDITLKLQARTDTYTLTFYHYVTVMADVIQA